MRALVKTRVKEVEVVLDLDELSEISLALDRYHEGHKYALLRDRWNQLWTTATNMSELKSVKLERCNVCGVHACDGECDPL